MNESGRVYWVLSPDCPRYSAGINGKYSQQSQVLTMNIESNIMKVGPYEIRIL